MGGDPIGEGYQSKGSSSTEGRILLVSRLEDVLDGLSPSAHQLKPKCRCLLNGSGPKAHVSGPWRLEEDESSFNIISRPPVGLPYNIRGGMESVLVLSNISNEFSDLRYNQSQFLPSTSSPFVSDRLLPSGEIFGLEGRCENYGGGDYAGFGQTPLNVMPQTCSPIYYGREMVVVEEQQMIQSTGGEKVEGGGGGGGGGGGWKMT